MAEDTHAEVESSTSEHGSGGTGADPLKTTIVDPLVGTVLDGRFEIEEVLGSGGAGVVYKAKQLRVNRHVAIKTIRMQVDNEVIRERFQREISSLCALNHPNIVTVYDCIFGWDGQPYVVMDYLKGLALDQLLKREGAMDLNRFARISLQIVSALEHAHKKDIVHRDLKPGNIVLIDDESDIVKVVDFGLAKLTHDRSLTKTGELWGSPPYMSPEQAQGEPSDNRSDIYSLGAVMYEMLSGKDPFYEVSTVYELIQAHVLTPPPRFSESCRNVKVPLPVEDTILRCLEKRPEDRFQTVGELQSALVDALSGQLEGDSRDYLLRFATRNISKEPPAERKLLPPRTTITREALQVTQKDVVPAPPPPRIQQNSRFSGPPPSAAERWIPWTIAGCSLLLALSLGVVVLSLLGHNRAVTTPPSTISSEKPNAGSAAESADNKTDSAPQAEPSESDENPKKTVDSKPAPHLVHKPAAGVGGNRSNTTISERKKARSHSNAPHTANSTRSSSTHSAPAKPTKTKKDPWGDLMQLQKSGN